MIARYPFKTLSSSPSLTSWPSDNSLPPHRNFLHCGPVWSFADDEAHGVSGAADRHRLDGDRAALAGLEAERGERRLRGRRDLRRLDERAVDDEDAHRAA